jgi:tRNA-specific 2-thiouridylase
MANSKNKRVVVAMSGGVDSSVVAALLKDQGYDVIGVTMQLYSDKAYNTKQKACCATTDINDASKVAEKIGIPHYILNYETVFKEQVIDKFVDSYINGYTPIPCVQCNQTVKFNDLYNFAKKLGAEFLATGHYVSKKTNNVNESELHKGVDPMKDQSYFLYSTTKEQLEFCEFPLGEKDKTQTRDLAHKYGLSVANKPDSQDICFVPNGDYFSVIQKYKPTAFQKGDIVEIETNKILGTHDGIAKYTLGQRKGIGVQSADPLFVIKLDATNNIVYVGSVKYLFKSRFIISNTHWLTDDQNLITSELSFKLRSSQKEVIYGNVSSEDVKKVLAQENIDITKFINPAIVTLKQLTRAITPGQACVFYKDTRVLGGGVIEMIID